VADVTSRERGRVYEFSVRLKVKRPVAEPAAKKPAGATTS
jgi:hypothetical protein